MKIPIFMGYNTLKYGQEINTMKTTMDIEDELLIECKRLAANRNTTMKAVIEQALRQFVITTSVKVKLKASFM